MKPNLLIATYIEKKYIDLIKAKFPNIEIIYRIDLIDKQRYQSDHDGYPNDHDSFTQNRPFKMTTL